MTPSDPQLAFLAYVGRIVDGAAPKIEAEVADDVDRLLDAARRTKVWRLGPVVVSYTPLGERWRLGHEPGCMTAEAPGHELLIATRRWWGAEEAGE